MNSVEIKNLPELTYTMREAMNQLKVNIEFTGEDVKTILVTSCNPNEGKSTVAFQLACSMARDDKKVCYMDADIRKSVFNIRYKVISAGKITGLAHLLSGDVSEIVHTTNVKNLDLVLAGQNIPDPTMLFKSKRFDMLIEVLRNHYDYVIIDTAPLGAVIDAAIIAPKCDGTVLVIEDKSTSGRQAQKVVKQLELANANMLGVVLNKTAFEHKKYYYYYSEDGEKKRKKRKQSSK